MAVRVVQLGLLMSAADGHISSYEIEAIRSFFKRHGADRFASDPSSASLTTMSFGSFSPLVLAARVRVGTPAQRRRPKPNGHLPLWGFQ